jgi:hypothetical protein
MRSLNLFGLSTAVASLLSALPAQPPPQWARLNVPGGVSDPLIQQIGKVIIVPEGSRYHVYSGFTKAWATYTPLVGVSSFSFANDQVVFVDGPHFTAFSGYTGRFATLSPGGTASLLNPASQQNDSIWLVGNGSTVWAFSTFRGQWVQWPGSGAPSATVERHVAVVTEANRAWGFSAFHGNWVQTSLTAPASAQTAVGTAATVVAGARVHGFSAMRNSWADRAAPPPSASRTVNNDLVVWTDQNAAVGFSGLTGSFDQVVASGPVSARADEQIAVVMTAGGESHAFSATRGAWTNVNAPPGAVLTVGPTAALFSSPGSVLAYSALTDSTANSVGAVQSTGLARSTGYHALQNGTLRLYSAILGAWFDGPAGIGTPVISDTGAIVVSANGLYAFSTRSGQYVQLLTATGGATVHVDAASAIMAVSDVQAGQFSAFDARRDAWVSVPLSTNPTVQIWRTCLLAVEGPRVLGYSAFDGVIHELVLPGSPVAFRARSEAGKVVTANDVYGFGSPTDLASLMQFPEFRRVFAIGAQHELQLAAPNGIAAFVYLSLGLMPPFTIPGIGDLHLDVTTLIPFPVPMVMASGRGISQFYVPEDPALRGLEVHFQALVGQIGSLYLSRPTSVLLF